MNFNDVLNAPALCEKCQIFLVKNYLEHEPRCLRCGGKICFYIDPTLFKGHLPKDKNECLSYWGFSDNFYSINPKIDNFFCLPNTVYKCPRCGIMNMKFIEIGCWD